jgi:hypothetical protein
VDVHFINENFSAGAADRVVGRDLNHNLVQILDDVLELLCSGLAHAYIVMEATYAQGHHGLHGRLAPC